MYLHILVCLLYCGCKITTKEGVRMAAPLLCLDVGGTELKGAPVGNGVLLASLQHFPAQSKESCGPLLDHFARVFRELDARSGASGPVGGLRLAFPGPFDYENGICLLQGLDKFDALFGVNLRDALFGRLSALVNDPMQIRFLNDVAAFALGELNFGSAVDTKRSMFVCIGTGCGSAFGLGNRLAPDGTPGVPPQGYIYPYPFLDSNIDDYISKRGLQKLAMQYTGQPLEGRELADLAHKGDSSAARCFAQFGDHLCQALKPFLADYQPNCLCIGGQVTKSIAMFGRELEKYCLAHEIHLHVTANTSEKTIQGIYTI